MRIVQQTLRSVAIVICFLLCSHKYAYTESYRDNTHHFTIVLPDNWITMSPETLATINDWAKSRMPEYKIYYNVGFLPQNQALESYPYILIQAKKHPMNNATYEDIERGFAKAASIIKKAEGSLTDIANNIAIGNVILDRAKNRIIMRMEMEVFGIDKVQILGVGMIGSKGIVFFYYYAQKESFQQYLPIFNTMIDSFQYDPGYTFVPKSSSFWGNAFLLYLLGGMAGVLIFQFVQKKPKL